jgi:predicted nucleic acid-binding Zn ribbon protein
MNDAECAVCGERLPDWSRADRRTCSVRCRVARQRHARRPKQGLVVVEGTATLGGLSAGVVAVTSGTNGSDEARRPAVTREVARMRLASWLADVSAEWAAPATPKGRTS